MLRISRNEGFERFVCLAEFLFAPLRSREQNVRIGGRRRVRVASDYLVVLLRGIGAR